MFLAVQRVGNGETEILVFGVGEYFRHVLQHLGQLLFPGFRVRHDVEHLVGDRQQVIGPGDAFDLVKVEHGADQRRAGRDVFFPGLLRPLGEFFWGPPFPVNHGGGALAFADMAALALGFPEGPSVNRVRLTPAYELLPIAQLQPPVLVHPQ